MMNDWKRFDLAGLARFLVLSLLLTLGNPAMGAGDTLQWETKQNRVSADIKSEELGRLLRQIASITHWQVYVEPGARHEVSAKFRDLPPGEALRLLLGDLNFALVLETNRASKLLVFRTAAKEATQLVAPSKLLPNELIVRLKPGEKIEELARELGAKVVGRIDGLNAYRLEFGDAKAAAAAREQLAARPDVAAVDSNYSIDGPPVQGRLDAASLAPPRLQLKPPADNGRLIVGLIDTAVQRLGNGLDSFLLNQVSVAGEASLDPNSPSHGTAMAETVLRGLQMMTKGETSVQILPVDVYGPNASTTTFDVANGIVQAVNGGAKIINLSLGSDGDSSLLHSVIQDATARNIIFIGAAGNAGTTTPFYPAAYPEVDSVTAIDQGQIASYANRGSWVSFGAPGTSVIYYNNQPWSVIGTSTSAAYLSGAISGYLDVTHASLDQGQTFIRNNFSLMSKPGK